jgi:formylglycine-generating enzyme required for sulfatase activity
MQRQQNARTIPDLKLDLVWIAPGQFRMGSPQRNWFLQWLDATRDTLGVKPNPGKGSEDDERPVTWVTLTQPFWLGRTDVTQGQYEALMGASPSYFKTAGRDAPVETVSWEDAMAFCRQLTGREQAAGRLPTGYVYTLPTEAQWEYACRAGTTDDYGGEIEALAWYDSNSGGTTHPVGLKQPNAWGLCDMHGNVWQWTRDWYGAYPGGAVTDPTGVATGERRVFRGGCWAFPARVCRSAIRDYDPPGNQMFNVGFRLALVPSPAR